MIIVSVKNVKYLENYHDFTHSCDYVIWMFSELCGIHLKTEVHQCQRENCSPSWTWYTQVN